DGGSSRAFGESQTSLGVNMPRSKTDHCDLREEVSKPCMKGTVSRCLRRIRYRAEPVARPGSRGATRFRENTKREASAASYSLTRPDDRSVVSSCACPHCEGHMASHIARRKFLAALG